MPTRIEDLLDLDLLLTPEDIELRQTVRRRKDGARKSGDSERDCNATCASLHTRAGHGRDQSHSSRNNGEQAERVYEAKHRDQYEACEHRADDAAQRV